MRRLHGVLTALALAAISAPAGAAEITRVVSSGEPGSPFAMDITLRWDRLAEKATIEHEHGAAPSGSVPGGQVELAERIDYQRTTNAIVPRIAVGIYRDLELHGELPYVLADDASWWYGSQYGNSSALPNTDPNSIAGNTVDASGNPCVPSPCPLFPVDPKANVYHGGRAGDLLVGVTWAIFNDRKDPTGPTWTVGLDVTLPTAQLYEPGKDRVYPDWSSPYSVPAKPGPLGEKIWKWDFHTAMSRKMGAVDPYVKAHLTLESPSSSTYSNCKYVNQLTTAGQMNDLAPQNCSAWGRDAGAKLPWVLGMLFGTEIVPFEDVADQQRLSIDFRLWVDYTSKQRFYNELTDATGKLLMTEGYAEAGGLLGVYLRASRYVTLLAKASLATRSPHYLTGESPSRGSGDVNPNYDARLDQPGRRFRISEVSLFALSFAGVLTF